MAENSSIEWTDATWNPIVGCSIVSPGCTNCYAMKQAARIERMTEGENRSREGSWNRDGRLKPIISHYAGTTQPSKAGAVWTGKIALAPDNILTAPLRWKRPRKIFVNSMGDLFHEDAPDEWIDRVFSVMALAPQHKFQVLTKRSARMREYLTARNGMGNSAICRAINAIPSGLGNRHGALEMPVPNCWLGVSAEDQRRADERVLDLLATPAAVRFVSAEPLLGPIDFTNVRFGWSNKEVRGSALTGYSHPNAAGYGTVHERLDWIIAGGESGPRSRPMAVQWAKDILAQCQNAGVACFVKQLSGPGGRAIKDMAQFPESLRVREFPLQRNDHG